jgi:hypothetical protein
VVFIQYCSNVYWVHIRDIEVVRLNVTQSF